LPKMWTHRSRHILSMRYTSFLVPIMWLADVVRP
jgi:hypothetical protein